MQTAFFIKLQMVSQGTRGQFGSLLSLHSKHSFKYLTSAVMTLSISDLGAKNLPLNETYVDVGSLQCYTHEVWAQIKHLELKKKESLYEQHDNFIFYCNRIFDINFNCYTPESCSC